MSLQKGCRTMQRTSAPSNLMVRHWWSLVLRGILAVIFGILVIALPGLALTSLVLLIGAYMFVDGILAIAGSLTHREQYQHWWLTLIEGIIGVIAGIIAFIYPGLTALTILIVIGVWAIFTAIFDIIAPIPLREVIHDEWLLLISGILSILFGLFVLFFPGTGALAILGIIAAYAIIFGVLLIILGFRLRNWRPISGGSTQVPPPV